MSPTGPSEEDTTAHRIHTWFRHTRRRLIRSLAIVGLSGTPFLIALSTLIGICGGVEALVFRWLIATS